MNKAEDECLSLRKEIEYFKSVTEKLEKRLQYLVEEKSDYKVNLERFLQEKLKDKLMQTLLDNSYKAEQLINDGKPFYDVKNFAEALSEGNGCDIKLFWNGINSYVGQKQYMYYTPKSCSYHTSNFLWKKIPEWIDLNEENSLSENDFFEIISLVIKESFYHRLEGMWQLIPDEYLPSLFDQ